MMAGDMLRTRLLLRGVIIQNVWWSLVHAAAEVTVHCGRDAVLPCGAQSDPRVSYTEVTWYKVNGSMLSVVAKQHLQTGDIFTDEESIQVLPNTHWSLMIKNSTAPDTGTYRCALRAPVGEINHDAAIELKVTGCSQGSQDENSSKRNTEMLIIFLIVFSLLLMFLNYTCLKTQSIVTAKAKEGLSRLLPLFTAEEIKNLHCQNKTLRDTELELPL
ncbi:CD83 antigen [Ambystoma mexicanum]|uniref:CD83 antigen n=1 Tax=Ambystoma mexicanum TaxID=8296 RepID=UPI0037E910A0